MIRLTDILREDVGEEAKRQGLEYLGFGRYGKDNKVTHRSAKGKLVPVKKSTFKPENPHHQSKIVQSPHSRMGSKPVDVNTDTKKTDAELMDKYGDDLDIPSKVISAINDFAPDILKTAHKVASSGQKAGGNYAEQFYGSVMDQLRGPASTSKFAKKLFLKARNLQMQDLTYAATAQDRFNTAADKSDAEDKAWAKEKGSKEVNRIKKLYGEPKPEQPANKSVRKEIPKDAHKTPEVHAKVAAAMSKFVNLPGGTFQWVDSKKGGHYKYDDTKDGKDYYAVVTPLDNDKYEINHWNPKTKFGRRKLPTKIVKGLKGVKKGLEPAVDTYYKPNDQKNEPAWVRGTGGKYYSSIDGAQWDGPGAGRGATPYSSAPYDPYAG